VPLQAHLTDAAHVVFFDLEAGCEPGSYPQWDDADRYYWADGRHDGCGEYHWSPDCAWLLTCLAHGGRLVAADEPPADAAERHASPEEAAHAGAPRLCRLCAQRLPPGAWSTREEVLQAFADFKAGRLGSIPACMAPRTP